MKEKRKIPPGSFSFKNRFKSFAYAFAGLKILISEEANSRIYLVSASLAIAAGILLKITPLEWIAIILCIGLVFIIELINSAIENICDFVSPERNDKIKKIKDLASAAVLVSAMTALMIGLIVFLPKLLHLVFA